MRGIQMILEEGSGRWGRSGCGLGFIFEFEFIEAFAIYAIDLRLGDEGVVVNRLDDAEDGHRLNLAAHHQKHFYLFFEYHPMPLSTVHPRWASLLIAVAISSHLGEKMVNCTAMRLVLIIMSAMKGTTNRVMRP